jgi:hypothetical protein
VRRPFYNFIAERNNRNRASTRVLAFANAEADPTRKLVSAVWRWRWRQLAPAEPGDNSQQTQRLEAGLGIFLLHFPSLQLEFTFYEPGWTCPVNEQSKCHHSSEPLQPQPCKALPVMHLATTRRWIDSGCCNLFAYHDSSIPSYPRSLHTDVWFLLAYPVLARRGRGSGPIGSPAPWTFDLACLPRF